VSLNLNVGSHTRSNAPIVVIDVRCASPARFHIQKASLRVDSLVCCAPPYPVAKYAADYDRLVLFSCRDQLDPVGLALSGSGTAENAVIKYATRVPPLPSRPFKRKKAVRRKRFTAVSLHLVPHLNLCKGWLEEREGNLGSSEPRIAKRSPE